MISSRSALTLAALALTLPASASRTYNQDKLLALAREAVKAEVEAKAPPAIRSKSPARPVFVTIEIKGRVVGCRGSLDVRSRSLEEEVVLAARAAASHDPRYRPLTRNDLKDFHVTITIVERTEPIGDVSSLAPADGLVLKAGGRAGIVRKEKTQRSGSSGLTRKRASLRDPRVNSTASGQKGSEDEKLQSLVDCICPALNADSGFRGAAGA
ncbi:MAG: AMMECR1 domain-containing protein [Armatimonadota bacterium]|nr:AMMECR1 domain-containing protein [Armatimonadota bacterium]